MGQALTERRALAQRTHGGEQTGLEPAAVLIQTLQIHVRGPETLILLHGGKVRGAGVEPAVERVLFLGEGALAPAVRAGKALGQDLGSVLFKPGVGALGGEEAGDGLDALVGADGLAAVRAVHHGDRQTPLALAGDAPVGALAHHALHAVDAPVGHPAHVVTGGTGVFLERLDRAEPLRGGAEDDGALAAPAVRIAVDDVLAGEQRAALLHVGQDHGIGLVGGHAGVLSGIVGVAAAVVHGDDHVHAVALAGLIVVGAEAGSGVHAAGTGFHGDVVGQHQAAGLGQERMVCEHVFKEMARMGLEDRVILHAADAHDLVHQRLGHDIDLAVGLVFHQRILLIRVEGDGQVAGQGPDRRGPDHEAELAVIHMGQLTQIVVHGELDVHRGDGVVLIFDFRLSQRGLVLGAPVHGLEALVDIALAVHRAEDLDLRSLKAGIHGLVGMLPVGHDAHALEALALHVDIMVGKLMAGVAELRHAHGLAVELVLLDDGALDGHAVVVPAGNVRRVVPAHGIGADDDVLKCLVQRVAHVQVAVGERGTVVQGEAGLALILLQHLVVQIHLFPALEHLRLAHGQTRAHGEAGLRHVERLFVLHVLPPILNICDRMTGSGQKKKPLSPSKRQRHNPLRYHSRWPLCGPLTPACTGRAITGAPVPAYSAPRLSRAAPR